MNKAICDVASGKIKLLLLSDSEGMLQRVTPMTGEVEVILNDLAVINIVEVGVGNCHYDFTTGKIVVSEETPTEELIKKARTKKKK